MSERIATCFAAALVLALIAIGVDSRAGPFVQADFFARPGVGPAVAHVSRDLPNQLSLVRIGERQVRLRVRGLDVPAASVAIDDTRARLATAGAEVRVVLTSEGRGSIGALAAWWFSATLAAMFALIGVVASVRTVRRVRLAERGGSLSPAG